MTGTFTKKGQISDAVQGAWIEFGSIAIDPASVAADAQGIETTAITGVKAGDLVFINAEALPKMVSVVGAKVTADDEVSVYVNNMYDATTAVNVGAIVIDIMIVHLT